MLKTLAIRAVTRFSWRISNARLARSLQRFSQVEADSAWQMLQALYASDDPAFQAKLFNNALEEVNHAALFAGLAREFASFPLALTADCRTQLYDPRRGLPEFEAQHFIGEATVFNEFEAYAAAAPVGRLREMFLQIRGDEEEHQKLAHAELIRMVGSEKATRSLIRRVRLKRVYEAWVRSAKAYGDFIASALLTVIYFVVGPFVAVACRRRLDRGAD